MCNRQKWIFTIPLKTVSQVQKAGFSVKISCIIYLTEAQWDISDLPFVQKLSKSLGYLEVELNASLTSA